jgi:hypothetical protein
MSDLNPASVPNHPTCKPHREASDNGYRGFLRRLSRSNHLPKIFISSDSMIWRFGGMKVDQVSVNLCYLLGMVQ